eukprot:TRINITY_DN589_c0_g1_i4.p1 TRINITY_DN589_c0_g1~~TRINITY_DN589_c0_g1_i4.p1  ORF type:complete len:255 (+),score=31.08 TRINITY_DN589_c0_g1_i4:133-897(+)
MCIRDRLSLLYLEDYRLFRNLTKSLSSILVEENIGFKKDDQWFLFPEEAVELFLLQKASIFHVANDKLAQDADLLHDDPKEIPILELPSSSKILRFIYDKQSTHHELTYLSMDTWKGYSFLKRKNFAVQRLRIEDQVKRIWLLNSKPTKKQKTDDEDDTIISMRDDLNQPFFEVFETAAQFKARTPSFFVGLNCSTGSIDGEALIKLTLGLGGLPLKYLIVNDSSFLLLDISPYGGVMQMNHQIRISKKHNGGP